MVVVVVGAVGTVVVAGLTVFVGVVGVNVGRVGRELVVVVAGFGVTVFVGDKDGRVGRVLVVGFDVVEVVVVGEGVVVFGGVKLGKVGNVELEVEVVVGDSDGSEGSVGSDDP